MSGDAGVINLPALPMEAIGQIGSLSRLDSSGDALPSLLLETDSGSVQIELCPFGPLVLLSSDGLADTDPIAQVLANSDIFPLFPADLDTAGLWHNAPLADWLFPHRLSRALALFDTLRY